MNRSWPALVVDKVRKEQLRWNQHGHIDVPNLPTEHIHISSSRIETAILELVRVSASHEIRQMAVLSWRWDVSPGSVSRNLFAAVLYARQAGIQYLFIDTVSIDQSLDKQNLIDEVSAFSQLYATLPAIRAYDKAGEHISSTARRPWVFHEQQLIKQSPYRPISVRQFSKINILRAGPDNAIRQWENTYFLSALLVLHGTIPMTDIADFRFLMPAIAQLLSRFHQEMCTNDYLLTVVLLSALNNPNPIQAPRSTNIHDLHYERYQFLPTRRKHEYSVRLDGKKIAQWGKSSIGKARELRFVKGARGVVLKLLGIDEGMFKRTRKKRLTTVNVSSGELSVKNGRKKRLSERCFFWVDLEGEVVWMHELGG
ncbi:hypothetical protein SLS60_009837 [Paraconiothyrium brasiliense]|uniref:Heterokaryon incompatibility domain-containing protein n=1 Tax=Paraconiothyrium brasiliense TaxID=300254 RepID=A0ABR3QSM1_9PLEO